MIKSSKLAREHKQKNSSFAGFCFALKSKQKSHLISFIHDILHLDNQDKCIILFDLQPHSLLRQ